jgi:hypothetical protein
MEVTRWSLIRRFVIVVALLPAVLNMSANAAGESAQPAASPAAKGKSPNVILITLDTTRADRMGFMGSKRGLRLNLDALAHQAAGLCAGSAPPGLARDPSDGHYPQFHHVDEFQIELAKDALNIPRGSESGEWIRDTRRIG